MVLQVVGAAWQAASVQIGLGWVVAGWASLTWSSPDESESVSDSGIWRSLNGAGSGHTCIVSFAGK